MKKEDNLIKCLRRKGDLTSRRKLINIAEKLPIADRVSPRNFDQSKYNVENKPIAGVSCIRYICRSLQLCNINLALSKSANNMLNDKLLNPYKPSVLFCGTSANSAKPDQTPHNAASDQVFHCLLTEVSFKI